jgi:hypothetical protein
MKIKYHSPQNFELINELIACNSELDHICYLLSELEKEGKSKILNDKIETCSIYRGEPEAYSTTLLPSILREPEKFRDQYFEKKILQRYRSNYPNELSLLANLGRMQHYKFPTRLLDWSKNFKTALRFACCSNPEKDGVVYVFVPSLSCSETATSLHALDHFDEVKLSLYTDLLYTPHNNESQIIYWEKAISNIHTSNMKPLLIPWCFVMATSIFNKIMTARQENQQSIFTFHTGYIDGNQYRIIPDEIHKKFGFYFIAQKVSRLIIPANFKEGILRNLLKEGISSIALFPDMPEYNEMEYLLEKTKG